MVSLLVAFIVSLLCPSETSWIEYDHDVSAFVGVCGDADGQAIVPIVQTHSHVVDIRE